MDDIVVAVGVRDDICHEICYLRCDNVLLLMQP